MKLIRTVFVSLYILLPLSAVAQTPPMEWMQCETDSDCTFVKNPCSENAEVNIKFVDAYEKLLVRTHPHCDKTEPRYRDAMPSCVDKLCVIILPYQ